MLTCMNANLYHQEETCYEMDLTRQSWWSILQRETSATGYSPSCVRSRVQGLSIFYKAVSGYNDIDVSNFVHFVNHRRTRRALTSKYLETPLCKTCTWSSSYFNHVVKLWNSICLLIDPSSFTSPSSFKLYLKMRYTHIPETVFDPDMTCTWSLKRDCGCHKQ
jgi:hypothetical protein